MTRKDPRPPAPPPRQPPVPMTFPWPPAGHEPTAPALPAFASAADALRAKIRACAARSFAAQHKPAVKTADLQPAVGNGEAAMAAGRSRAGQENARGPS
jgi:hypothetical protein